MWVEAICVVLRTKYLANCRLLTVNLPSTGRRKRATFTMWLACARGETITLLSELMVPPFSQIRPCSQMFRDRSLVVRLFYLREIFRMSILKMKWRNRKLSSNYKDTTGHDVNIIQILAAKRAWQPFPSDLWQCATAKWLGYTHRINLVS